MHYSRSHSPAPMETDSSVLTEADQKIWSDLMALKDGKNGLHVLQKTTLFLAGLNAMFVPQAKGMSQVDEIHKMHQLNHPKPVVLTAYDTKCKRLFMRLAKEKAAETLSPALEDKISVLVGELVREYIDLINEPRLFAALKDKALAHFHMIAYWLAQNYLTGENYKFYQTLYWHSDATRQMMEQYLGTAEHRNTLALLRFEAEAKLDEASRVLVQQYQDSYDSKKKVSYIDTLQAHYGIYHEVVLRAESQVGALYDKHCPVYSQFLRFCQLAGIQSTHDIWTWIVNEDFRMTSLPDSSFATRVNCKIMRERSTHVYPYHQQAYDAVYKGKMRNHASLLSEETDVAALDDDDDVKMEEPGDELYTPVAQSATTSTRVAPNQKQTNQVASLKCEKH